MSYTNTVQASFDRTVERVPARFRVYLPIIPVMVLVGVFILYPIVQAIYSSFFEKSLLSPGDAEFVGLANYQEIYTNPDMHQVLINTAIWVVVGSIAAILIGFVVGGALRSVGAVSLFGAMLVLMKAFLRFGWPYIERFYESRQPDERDPNSMQHQGFSRDTMIFLTLAIAGFVGIFGLIALEAMLL